jgi:predicted transglutaminase-like cysteine proteinase
MTAEVMKKEVSRKMNQLMRLFSQKIMMLLKVNYQNSTRTANATDSQKNGQDETQKFSGKEKSQEFDS